MWSPTQHMTTFCLDKKFKGGNLINCNIEFENDPNFREFLGFIFWKICLRSSP